MSSSSSEEEWNPVGFDRDTFLTQVRKKKVVSKKNLDDDSDLPSELHYFNLLNRAYTEFANYEEAWNRNISALKLPLDVRREPGNHTSINLIDISEALKREPKHLKSYIEDCLLLHGTVNSKNRLVFNTVVMKNSIQNAIRKYYDTFNMCGSCQKGEDTEIVRENKLSYVRCRLCGGKKHVSVKKY
ncbi:hypothetical protein EDEG_03181 [Edhazardia aedis USNM 41457]|uniref:Translation initiation factor IF2/IF5 domain-containing protein n=1 Tax=Edhazardia aedis (strain USNM 41457) TaxID=1003232 RepID=J9DIE6_EDHAE|nr:hypothetical protein EDEG_03181 [Edhazardia aedis USNM 41457]|eukprot:EJW02395.1 hypothetical protein EDEG_03181 [Edhazardia aedis USNM 41457]